MSFIVRVAVIYFNQYACLLDESRNQKEQSLPCLHTEKLELLNLCVYGILSKHKAIIRKSCGKFVHHQMCSKKWAFHPFNSILHFYKNRKYHEIFIMGPRGS